MKVKKKKYKLKSNLKYLIYVLAFLLVASIAYFGFYMSEGARNARELKKAKEESLQSTYDNLDLKLNNDLLNLEYGTEFKMEDLIKECNGDYVVNGEVDANTVGTYPLNFTVSTVDEYDQKVEKEFSCEINVADTKAPIIEVSEGIIFKAANDEFDVMDNIVRVYDEVDGDITYSNELSNGSYVINNNVDMSRGGVYDVTISAKDSNGNDSEVIYKVEVIAAGESIEYPYYISINRALNNVTIYAIDEFGEYTIPVKAMVCSTGDVTPLGVYQTDINYEWRLLFGNVYGQYATRIVGDILFHSVPYFTQDKGDLEYEEYNKLGTKASMGCIRLAVKDAKWIFDNCPLGTTVELYDDFNNVGPLGKPEPIMIDINSPNRGWDPTDPDPANPWNN